MTTPTLIATSPPAPVLDLEMRFVLSDVIMTARLEQAAVEFEVRTAHIEGADPIPYIADVVPLTPTTAPPTSPYSTPIADTLWRARHRIETDGWCRGARRDEAGARCPDGAIRVEAPTGWVADDAVTLLLEAIRRHHRDASSVPSWNDAQTSPRPVLLALGQAAELAHARGL